MAVVLALVACGCGGGGDRGGPLDGAVADAAQDADTGLTFCRMVFEEDVGQPQFDQPNGAFFDIDEPCETSERRAGIAGATVRRYSVRGDSLAAACDDLFDRAGPVGRDGKRYAGRTTAGMAVRLGRVGEGKYHIDSLSLVFIVELPSWTPPAGGPESEATTWSRMADGLETHEQGHIDRYNQALGALQDATVCHDVKVPEGGDAQAAALDFIGGTDAYGQMRSAQTDYDDATSHGEDVGAQWP